MKRLTRDLSRLGLRRGAAVLVHSSLRALGRGRNGAEALWNALREVTGPEGTVLVPSLSYDNVTERNPVFDVRTTASCVGAFPEWVRTRPGVIRSVHPTHSVAGAGRLAGKLLSGHRDERTPAGPGSPYRRLCEAHGFILMVGCGLRPNTSIHGIEELCRVPYLFDHHTEFTCTDAAGKMFSGIYRCHGHFRQNYHRIADLLSSEELGQGQVGRARCFLVDAAALWTKVEKKLRNDPTYFIRGS